MVRFVDALQHFERAFEPDRRIDAMAGEDYLPHLLERVERLGGRIFIAESEGHSAGWAVFYPDESLNYVIAEERRYGYIAELYVEERMRGCGAGRALIEACEAEAKTRGLKLMMIGVVARNERAARVYQEAGFRPYTMQLRKYL